MDVSDIFYFFCSGRGKGESGAPGAGGGSVFYWKSQEGGGVPGGGGAGKVGEFLGGGGGPKYFFSGPKRPPRFCLSDQSALIDASLWRNPIKPVLPCDRKFLHYSKYVFWNEFRHYITFSLPQVFFGWNHVALHYIILTTTLKFHLFFVFTTLHWNFGSKLILRYITLWLHQKLFSELKM